MTPGELRSGPFIRSIPQNKLNSEGTLGPIGGTSFYSVNLTVSEAGLGSASHPQRSNNRPAISSPVQRAKKYGAGSPYKLLQKQCARISGFHQKPGYHQDGRRAGGITARNSTRKTFPKIVILD